MSAVLAYEAVVMKHPHARKGKVTQIKGVDAVSGRPFTDSQGEPDVFPDVTVKDPHTEAYYRARGYIIPGEVPPPPAEYAEYPVMLVHPEHVDAIPDDWHIEKGDNGEIIRHKILGKPEVFPPRQANTEAEEESLGQKGYKRAGQDNPDAIRSAHASPYVPGRKTQEYPKMVNGEIEDPEAPSGGPIQYPKWIGDKLVHSRAEEEALTGKKADVVLDVCIICDEIILEGQPAATGKNGMFHTAHLAGGHVPTAVPPVAVEDKIELPDAADVELGEETEIGQDAPKKRIRRTKAQIEADNAAAELAKREKPAKAKVPAGE
jgi:hypothetical protein